MEIWPKPGPSAVLIGAGALDQSQGWPPSCCRACQRAGLASTDQETSRDRWPASGLKMPLRLHWRRSPSRASHQGPSLGRRELRCPALAADQHRKGLALQALGIVPPGQPPTLPFQIDHGQPTSPASKHQPAQQNEVGKGSRPKAVATDGKMGWNATSPKGLGRASAGQQVGLVLFVTQFNDGPLHGLDH